MEPIFALTRLCQFAAGMVVCGSPLFFLYGLKVAVGGGLSRLVPVAGVVGALATLGWMMAQAAAFGAGPGDALKPEAVWAVASGTDFGQAAAARTGLFLAAAAWSALAVRTGKRVRWGLTATAGTLAAASFAWTGHGVSDDGIAGVVHIGADVAHLITAAVWLGALGPLAILASRCGPGAAQEKLEAARDGMAAFSGIGLAVVAGLVATGLINSWFLIGPAHLAQIPTTPYGLMLLAKLCLFALMLGLAALNRYRLTPALERSLDQDAAAAVAAMRKSILLETALGLLVIACVAVLGTLSPLTTG